MQKSEQVLVDDVLFANSVGDIEERRLISFLYKLKNGLLCQMVSQQLVYICKRAVITNTKYERIRDHNMNSII